MRRRIEREEDEETERRRGEERRTGREKDGRRGCKMGSRDRGGKGKWRGGREKGK